MMCRPKRRDAILLALLLLLPMLASCSDAPATRARARPVLFEQVATSAPPVAGPFVGTVQSRQQVSLAFEQSGRLVSRHVEVGQLVRKGEVLAVLDATVLLLQRQSAVSEIARAQAVLDSAQATEARTRALNEQDIASKGQLETIVAAREAAQAELERVKINLELAERQVDEATLRAEFDGVVTAVTAEIGQVVTTGTGIVTIARPDLREAVIDVPEAVAAGMAQGTSMLVQFQIDPGIETTGTVREIAATADPVSRTRRVRLSLFNPDPVFRLGTMVSVSVRPVGVAEITLPQGAVVRQGDVASVWIADAKTSTVMKRPVRLGLQRGDRVAVSSGVKPGERVVIAGIQSLAEGQTIRFIEDSQQ